MLSDLLDTKITKAKTELKNKRYCKIVINPI